MTLPCDHISVCVCTYKRPKLLANLLTKLQNQVTDGLFTYSIVIVDNDYAGSAKGIAEHSKGNSVVPIDYYNEPTQNIALARNKALENAKGDFIAFIDDDEFPVGNWLLNLYNAEEKLKADGILGPVIPWYETEPPKWVVRGKFYERPSHDTGSVLHWTNTRTGNVLLRRAIFRDKQNMFRSQFGMGGEDRDFFRRMIGKGSRFVWCGEAPVYEVVPSERFKRSFMLKRALLRGKIPHFGHFDMVKSVVAIPLYSLALPVLLLLGHHRFMKYLISDFDHIGRILAFCRIDVIKEKYVIG
jgi:succinoglycan biosynthesis protein ExoM